MGLLLLFFFAALSLAGLAGEDGGRAGVEDDRVSRVDDGGEALLRERRDSKEIKKNARKKPKNVRKKPKNARKKPKNGRKKAKNALKRKSNLANNKRKNRKNRV